MKDSDITMIEQELGIALPESYKRAVVPFRIPALAGNTDYQLWLWIELLSLVAAAVVVVIIMFGIAWLRSWLKKH